MANLSHLPAQWRKSGLSQREFCNREGINLATFSYWRNKELRGQLTSADEPSTFREVIVHQEANPLAIEITYPDGTHVRIPMPSRC